MGLDIRLPIGGMFVLLGAILFLFGLATAGDTALYARSLQIDMNLWWGAVMLAFGGIMLALALRKQAPKKD
jgi:membrane-bound ClpP family serine protease